MVEAGECQEGVGFRLTGRGGKIIFEKGGEVGKTTVTLTVKGAFFARYKERTSTAPSGKVGRTQLGGTPKGGAGMALGEGWCDR